MGLSFEVVAPQVDETPISGEHPVQLARRLGLAKALIVAEAHPEALVIGSDTLVVQDNRVFGKPPTASAAFEMLAALRDREHLVYSGLALVDPGRERRCVQTARTSVQMRCYSDEEIRRYIESGDPQDKAGAYAIQSSGFSPVARVKGCYANVMGLAMCHLYRALRLWGVRVPIHPLDCCPLAVDEGCQWSSSITGAPAEEWCACG